MDTPIPIPRPSHLLCALQIDWTDNGVLKTYRKIEWVPIAEAFVGSVLHARCPRGMWISEWEVMEVLVEKSFPFREAAG